MELSYLDYIRDFQDGVFQIDDESMINYVMDHYGFINRNSPDFLFFIRSRKYNICNDKELADEVYKDIYKFIQEIKSIDTNLPLEDYVSSLLNLVINIHNFHFLQKPLHSLHIYHQHIFEHKNHPK